MLFIPYRFDFELNRVPIFTILISLTCLLIYLGQYRNELEYEEKTESFCQQSRDMVDQMAMKKALGGTTSQHCISFVTRVSTAEDPQKLLDEYADNSEKFLAMLEEDSKGYVRDFLAQEYNRFSLVVPKLKTKKLWYHPHSWNPIKMLTSNFSHGSWDHVIGNLIFFFAFAAAVELIVGSLAYLFVVLVIAYGTSISYSLSMISTPDALPTVGLSGIVMGMMALLTYFLPWGRIRCFWWFIIRFGTIPVPAWLLFLWYSGFDVYYLLTNEEMGEVNLISHVSGAFIGLLLGLTMFRGKKRKSNDLMY